MAWIEGLTSSNRILLDFAKIFTQANKLPDGSNDVEKNWEIVYPRPFNVVDVVGESLVQDGTTTTLYTSSATDWFEQNEPIIYETVDSTTEVVTRGAYTVNYQDGTISFNEVPTGVITADFSFVTDRALETAFAKIEEFGRLVFKTKTTPVSINPTDDPFGTDPDLAADDLEMFIEMRKDKILKNPETGLPAAKYKDTTGAPIENHYHIDVRIFDRYDYVNEKPVEQVVDGATNLILDYGAHVSPWSKFAWYMDFKEYMADSLDSDPGSYDVDDGIAFAFVDTPGIYGELPIQYWISINNDRLALVLMGEPSINYDHYLISFAYLGKIDSFEDSKNDTAGNFAITTGSSTIPCDTTTGTGVIRDSITGGITNVKFPKIWGVNTATGVNDISMYKTRSGVYYQRHQASFITPEGFMQKDAFNPSRWTGKFHLSPMYVVHGYDGYRGWLKDVVVVDDSSIVNLDELVVGKGTANEEIYKYFKLNAPFSLMQTSANASYGIGIKKI